MSLFLHRFFIPLDLFTNTINIFLHYVFSSDLFTMHDARILHQVFPLDHYMAHISAPVFSLDLFPGTVDIF